MVKHTAVISLNIFFFVHLRVSWVASDFLLKCGDATRLDSRRDILMLQDEILWHFTLAGLLICDNLYIGIGTFNCYTLVSKYVIISAYDV